MHAAKQVQKIPIEESDVAVQCTLMSDELRKRNMTEYKIKRVSPNWVIFRVVQAAK